MMVHVDAARRRVEIFGRGRSRQGQRAAQRRHAAKELTPRRAVGATMIMHVTHRHSSRF
jgi:hypothetical protein